jgi:enoyl-CoA hydratase/carnithine racemase
LAAAVTTIERSDACGVLVRSEGEDFSFGGDIMTWPAASVQELRARFGRVSGTICRSSTEHIPLPVIAAVWVDSSLG